MTKIEILGHASPYALNGMYHHIADEEVKDIITFDCHDQRSGSVRQVQYKRVENHPSAPNRPRYAFIGSV